MNNRSRLMVAMMLATVVAAGCTGPAQTAKKEAPAPSAAAAAPAPLAGKVAETMDGGGYTYISLDRDGKKSWVAIPTAQVTVGQQITLMPGAEMHNFPSKALNRTFDTIIFSGGIQQGAQQGAQPAAPAQKPAKAAYEKPVLAGKVVETMEAANYSYVRVEKDGKSSWSAVPTTEVAVGDEVEVQPGTEMGQFTSKTLNRTFDNIYFASGLKKVGAAAPAAKEGAAAPAAKKEAAAPAAKEEAKGDAAAALPPGHPKLDAAAKEQAAPAAQPAAPAQAPEVLTGKVVETQDAGGYTYVCLEKEGKKSWVAMPISNVKVGQEVKVQAGVVMTNFVSKSMNKTFEAITFSNGLAN